MKSYRPEAWLAIGFLLGVCRLAWVHFRQPMSPAAHSALLFPGLAVGVVGGIITAWVTYSRGSDGVSPASFTMGRLVAPLVLALSIGVTVVAATRPAVRYEHVAVTVGIVTACLSAGALALDAVKGPAILSLALLGHCYLVLGTGTTVDPARSLRWSLHTLRAWTGTGGAGGPQELRGDDPDGATDRVRRSNELMRDVSR